MRTARRSVTIRKRADAGGITVRCGDTVLGTISGLSGSAEAGMSGPFSHTPAYVEYADTFLALARGTSAGSEASNIEALHDDIERLGVHVHHSVHDMRIDVPKTLIINAGEARFRASDAFLMMRTGGLG
jgi:hypothetical protein